MNSCAKLFVKLRKFVMLAIASNNRELVATMHWHLTYTRMYTFLQVEKTVLL